MLAHDVLHASVFGRHFHPCPGELCQGKSQPCSDPYDCQPGPKLCGDCAYLKYEYQHDKAEQDAAFHAREEWRRIEETRWL